jgi:ketosteroid isomerase-like protein
MDDDPASTDDRAIKELDRSWNEVYLRNDRSAFAEILADDFRVNFSDGRTAGKVDLMRPTPAGATVVFSEAGMQMFTPTAVTWGRARISHPDRVVDQRYVRVYSKRGNRWQAVFVIVFPVGAEA